MLTFPGPVARPPPPLPPGNAGNPALFATCAPDLERIFRLLERNGVRAVPITTWRALRQELRGRRTAVLVIPWLDRDLPAAELGELVRERPWGGHVLLTERDPTNLRLLGRTGVSEVLFLGAEERELPACIRRVHLDGFFARARASIRAGGLPPCLRAALLLALEQEPSACDGPHPPARSVRSLARRISRSEDHLTRMAREHGVDLRAFLDWCIALRALELHWGSGEKWERVAWRLGYASVSGLSEQLKHTLGQRPREIAAGDMEGFFSRFEHRLVPVAARACRNA